MKPVFKSTPTQFQTILFATVDESDVGDVVKDVVKEVSESQQKILLIIQGSPTISGRQMSEMLSVSQRTVERDLSALTKKGAIKHKGKDNDGEWVLTELGLVIIEMLTKQQDN